MAENFRELDPETVWKLLEGHTDVLAGEEKKEAAFLRACACPMCAALQHTSFLDAQRLYTPGALLPARQLRCSRCGCEWDPRTGIVTQAPTPTGG